MAVMLFVSLAYNEQHSSRCSRPPRASEQRSLPEAGTAAEISGTNAQTTTTSSAQHKLSVRPYPCREQGKSSLLVLPVATLRHRAHPHPGCALTPSAPASRRCPSHSGQQLRAACTAFHLGGPSSSLIGAATDRWTLEESSRPPEQTPHRELNTTASHPEFSNQSWQMEGGHG